MRVGEDRVPRDRLEVRALELLRRLEEHALDRGDARLVAVVVTERPVEDEVARLRAGLRDGQEQESGSLVYGELQAALSSAEKYYVDHTTGEMTFLVTETALIDGTGELGPLGVAFAAGDTSVVALTVDALYQPVGVEFLSYRLDESGRDFSSVTERDEVDRRFGTATASGELGEPSMYEITTRLDLRNHPELADRLLTPYDALNDRELRELLDRLGDTRVAEYEVGSGRYGFSADLGALLEFSAGGGVTREEGPNPWRPSRSAADSPPVHQLGVSRAASSSDDRQSRKHSLERR